MKNCELGETPADPRPGDNEPPRYLMLNGYRSAVKDFPEYGVKKGWQCTNCNSMVYLNKCPNDACYNFQVLTSYEYNLEERIWGMLKASRRYQWNS